MQGCKWRLECANCLSVTYPLLMTSWTRTLGLPGGKSVLNYGSQYKKQAPQNYRIWTTEVRCTGDESWIGSCTHPTWGEHECTHDMDVGVCCEKDWEKPMMVAPAVPLL
jgi:hypothetical protein